MWEIAITEEKVKCIVRILGWIVANERYTKWVIEILDILTSKFSYF